MLLLILTLLFIISYSLFSVRAAWRHERNIKSQFEHRIHVNGIRGKSSVTRLIAGAMREAGIRTVGKTTGTNARIMVSHSIDWPVERKEANISEQRKLIKRYLNTKYKAIVFECMAVNPLYQKYLEDKIMHSTISVITNVREDHVDQMGKTLPEIAKSLSATIPRNGHLVTAEKDKELLEVFQKACDKKAAILHAVGQKRVWNEEMAGFDHFEYKDNVSITIQVAEIMGIDRSTALKGMKKALPDPGAFKLQSFAVGPNTIYWANLFAINDRESFVKTVKTLSFSMDSKHKKAIILNNRKDRPERVAQFIDIALNNFRFDYIFTFGDYERRVVREVRQHKSRSKPKVICLGNSTQYRDANGKLLWQKIQENIPSEACLLVGAVNIHTMQSQNLLKTLSKEEAVYAS